MRRLALLFCIAGLMCAAAPASAMEIRAALDATEGTRAHIGGVVDAVGADSEHPYLVIETDDGKCGIEVEVIDRSMIAGCSKGVRVTAIGILRWDEGAAWVDDIDVNFLDEASVVCE